jgi:xanthine dehydrogenase YagR molybdenum-binding subunit
VTTVGQTPVIGAALDRVDGPLKVTGRAQYPSDFAAVNSAHAALVQSTVAAGRIVGIDTSAAEAAPGVVAVITHMNAPRLRRGPMTALGASPRPPFQDDRILHHGQHVALVVADTAEQATYAAELVSVQYAVTEAVLRVDDPRAAVLKNPWNLDSERGDIEPAFADADVIVEGTFTTPDNTNNPLGLFCTFAQWDGGRLTVHDSTQWPSMERDSLALIFGVHADDVRVVAPFVGGGFGNGLRVWPHVILTVLAARLIDRPVKLVLTRPQMFTSLGHRPASEQHIRIGARSTGQLVALEHSSVSPVAMEDDDYEPVAAGSAVAYTCPNMSTRDRQVRLNIPCPTSMRGPAEAQGNFALECAMDELSYALGMDPVELRLRNYTDVDPKLGLPWTSKALRECYEVGARRFGWSTRKPEPRSTRDGHWLVGYGMAGVGYPWYQAPCRARASITAAGRAYVTSAATDIGTGTYTVMAQLAAEALGLAVDQVRFDLGDSDMPESPQAGGSGLTGALGSAVQDACEHLLSAFVDLVRDDPRSPLHGVEPHDLRVVGGVIARIDDPTRCETYSDVLARHRLYDLTADGASTPAVPKDLGMAPAGAFGAKFVEARVDVDLGLVRVKRVVSVIDGGRILNAKTATSQIIGGTVGGIGMALFEETITDAGSGRIANATLADYLVAVNADIPELDVVFVGEPDRGTPIGTKGVGEVGLVGVAAAVANAVYHATGRRIRSLPITVDDLL